MYSTRTITIAATAAIFLGAPIAIAGEAKLTNGTAMSDKGANESITNATDQTVTAPRVQTDSDEYVMGAVERSDYVAVIDEEGMTYYNKIVNVADLPSPILDIKTVDTYKYEHEGRTYTNKVVTQD